MPTPAYLWITTQHDAERVLRDELPKWDSGFKPAYSRPGFITFKTDRPLDEKDLARVREQFPLIRLAAAGHGRWEGESLPADLSSTRFDVIHAFVRDPVAPGTLPPQVVREKRKIPEDIQNRLQTLSAQCQRPLNTKPKESERVLNILIDPSPSAPQTTTLWLSLHTHVMGESPHPGGVFDVDEESRISRAAFKLIEVLERMRFEPQADDHALEIGCAPGGALEVLLERGCLVTGVDPGSLDARVLSHPNLVYIPHSFNELTPRDIAPELKWLLVDINSDPHVTLRAIQKVFELNPDVRPTVIATLKLGDFALLGDLPHVEDRLKSLGLRRMFCRQLYFNRREIVWVGTPLRRRIG